jgi:hypothetical protein
VRLASVFRSTFLIAPNQLVGNISSTKGIISSRRDSSTAEESRQPLEEIETEVIRR